MSLKWINTDSLLYCNNINITRNVKIASFDLDDTLIIKNNKLTIEYVHENLKNNMQDLIKKNYHISIFSNQLNLKNEKLEKIKNIFQNIRDDLFDKNTSFSFFVSKLDDYNRKPNIGMWQKLTEKIDSINMNKSFYCGDAAGRLYPSAIKKKIHKTSKTGDFSDSDIKFAINIGIDFITPDNFYLGTINEKYVLQGYDPDINSMEICNYNFDFLERDVIILCGYPGSGKSSFYKNVLKQYNYDYYNPEITKSYSKKLNQSLEKGKNIIIDSLGYDPKKREKIIKAAIDNNYSNITCILFKADRSYAEHMNNVRHLLTGEKKIPKIVYNVYDKYYVKPTKKEGFTRILQYTPCLDPEIAKNEQFIEAFNIKT